MAFKFDSDSQQKVTDMLPPKARVSKFTLIIMGSFAFLVILLIAWQPMATAVRAVLARRNAKEVHEAVEAQDWARAYKSMTLARQRAPQDIEVITANVAFLKATASDPSGLAQQLQLLASKRPLTEDEELLLGRSLIKSGKTKDARAMLDSLPAQHGAGKPGLELLSSILAAEGHEKEAAEAARRAAMQSSDDPEAQFQSAMTNLESNFVETRKQALKQLWQFAELNTETGLNAINRLASYPGLTLPEANRLLALTEKHPLKSLAARLAVISALMRLQPQLRTQLAEAEIQQFLQSKNGSREVIAFWLMRENFNDQVLDLVPRELAMQSRELFPILMQTLAQANRWEELQEVLKTQRVPVPTSLLDLAMAEVQSHLHPDMREARRLLQGTIDNSRQGGDVSTLHKAAMLAEKLNLADISCAAYMAAGLILAANNDSLQALQNLQKSVELALLAKDTATLLDASRWLHKLSPSSAVYADRFAYWRLVLGIEMETVDLAAQQEKENTKTLSISLERIPTPLLHALSAYRLGDLAAMNRHLADLHGSSCLAAGPRAVAAGLLSLSGRPDQAFALAEKIPGGLLLNEEMTFLKKAL